VRTADHDGGSDVSPRQSARLEATVMLSRALQLGPTSRLRANAGCALAQFGDSAATTRANLEIIEAVEAVSQDAAASRNAWAPISRFARCYGLAPRLAAASRRRRNVPGQWRSIHTKPSPRQRGRKSGSFPGGM
jgi:hypothetical protein